MISRRDYGDSSVNLPDARSGRWGQGLTEEKMAECRRLKPVPVGKFEFVEWTPDGHLRHSRFVALRGDNNAREVSRMGSAWPFRQ